MPLFKKSELGGFIKTAGLHDSKMTLIKEALEFNKDEDYDIFLSHSYQDANEILNLKREIENMGFSIYVDWIDDPKLDRNNVSKKTAQRFKEVISSCKCLFYVTSENAINSKWMPWELGYADGNKDGFVAILPISDEKYDIEIYRGQEYLGLYSYITRNRIYGSKRETLLVHDNRLKYVDLKNWLDGKLPSLRLP